MKIRNGFVSNSSSSSFVIRGIKMKETELAEIFELSAEDDIEENFDYGKGVVTCRSTKYYFGGDPTGEVIVGVEFMELDDGTVKEMKEPDDDKIREKIEAKLGIKINKPLKTYIQYVSNDNY